MHFVNSYFCMIQSDQPPPSYEQFYNNVMRKNIVCLLDSRFTLHWPAKTKWIDNGKINFDYLRDQYGSCICPVYNCNKKYFDSNPMKPMSLREYIDNWKSLLTRQINGPDGDDILYLKDWHFFQQTHDPVYRVPELFESDYLNEYCLENNLTDYRFVYMGPKMSSTPLHIDVFGSFSWSANICGLKKWLVIPHCNVLKLRQLLKQQLPNDLYSLDGCNELFKQVDAFEVFQKSGEILFIPSGYMHQVINLEDTISINHNWFNACNLNFIYDNIVEANREVEHEMSDLKSILDEQELFDKCQKILSMHFGINHADFVRIIEHISRRLSRQNDTDTIQYRFRFFHDVETILSVTLKILSNSQFACYFNRIEKVAEEMRQIQSKFQI